MRIISFIDETHLIKKIVQCLGYGKNRTPFPEILPEKEIKELIFDPSYSQLS